MEILIEQVANVGFPIAVAAYLLVRIETKLTLLSESIHDLSNSILILNK